MKGPPADVCQNSIPAVAEIQNSETENQTDSEQANCSDEVSMLVDEAMSQGEKTTEKKDTALLDYLNDFFVKNCYGYKPKQSASAIQKLTAEIEKLSDEVNPAVDVAAVLCGEYKKMCEGARTEYWKGQPILPAYMLKPRCWMELLQYAGKILATKTNQNKFEQAMAEAREKVDAERGEVAQWMNEECAKYGIDPASPTAQAELIRAKSLEQKENPVEREMPEDIF
jgi:hypothetical protein